jgi:hypothetical protein
MPAFAHARQQLDWASRVKIRGGSSATIRNSEALLRPSALHVAYVVGPAGD